MGRFDSLLRELRRVCPELPVLEEEPLSAHCSFRIGGPCAALIQPRSVEETEHVCRLLREADRPPLLMGRGTNLLITDEPLDRIVVQMSDGMAWLEQRGDGRLFAGSGISLYKLAVAAAAASLTGLEFAHGIPGSLGGAVSMNAGAYGGEMKDVLTGALWLDGELRLREGGDLDLSYRHSRFSDTEDVILGAELKLRKGDEDEIQEKMQELMNRRRQSQPLELPSAGSTFKRPVGGYAAALIDQAGLKGFAVGGAMVSPKHAGFVVNVGGATFEDVLRLMDAVQQRVYETSGIQLEPEVKIIRG